MKKLMTLMLGMAFVFTTVAVTFAQDTPKKEETQERRPPRKRRATPPRRTAAKRFSPSFCWEAA